MNHVLAVVIGTNYGRTWVDIQIQEVWITKNTCRTQGYVSVCTTNCESSTCAAEPGNFHGGKAGCMDSK